MKQNIITTATLVAEHKTNFTYVGVYMCQLELAGETLYIIKSTNLKTGIDYIRFGNRIQAISILNTYRKQKRFSL